MGKLTFHLIRKLVGVDIEQLQEDNNSLMIKAQQLSFDVKDANKEAAYKRMQLSETQEELTKTQSELAQSQTTVAELQKEITGLQEEISRLQDGVSDLQKEKETECDNLQHSNEQLTSLKQQNDVLLQEKEAAESHVKEQETNIRELSGRLTALTAEYEQEKEKLAQKTSEVNDLTDRMAKTENELQQSIAQTNSLNAELDNARQSIAEMQRQADADKTALSKTQTQIQELQDSYLQLQNDSIAQSEENQSLKQRAEEVEKTLAEVESKLSELQARKDEAEADKQTVIAQLTDLQKENAQLKEQLAGKQEAQPEEEKEEETTKEEREEGEEKNTQSEEPRQQPEQEKPAQHPTDIVEAYQEMKAKLEEATLKFPYTRITCTSDCRQYIFDSHTLGLKAELFVWGAEGKEVVLDENHFIPYDEIDQIEGIDNIYSTEQITNSGEEEDATAIAETLLAAICASRPVHVTYRDKNGRISEKNLYWLCFQPADRRTIRLPYDGVFDDMFEEKIDPEHIVAMSAHNGEPRIFIISQILSIQVFDCFFSNARGSKTCIEGMRIAVRHEQPEAAEVIYNTLPDKLKETPKVISSLANAYLLQGEYEKAVKLYLSLKPEQTVEGKTGWADYNLKEFDELIRRGIEPEAFMQLKEALKEEGWEQ